MADAEYKHQIPLLPILLGIFTVGAFAAFLIREPVPEQGTAPERARFMLDCVADFQYAPATCRAVLDGAPPPQVPDAMGEPGC